MGRPGMVGPGNVPQNSYMQQGQQQHNPQMMGQQGGHYQLQQDAQLMNQTKDQMLLQGTNKMGHMTGQNSGNLAGNANQQINPTDKLSQVVDDL